MRCLPVVQKPDWTPPPDLKSAALFIDSLGKNLSEHVFVVGLTLRWVRDQVGHGKFTAWVQENVWFSPRTARRWIAFAEKCSRDILLLEYEANPKPKTAIMADLNPTWSLENFRKRTYEAIQKAPSPVERLQAARELRRIAERVMRENRTEVELAEAEVA
jgi:hypothetical protein